MTGRTPILSEAQVAKVRRLRAEGLSITVIGERFGVDRRTIALLLDPEQHQKHRARQREHATRKRQEARAP